MLFYRFFLFALFCSVCFKSNLDAFCLDSGDDNNDTVYLMEASGIPAEIV